MCTIPDRQLRTLEKEQIVCHDVKSLFGEYTEGDLIPSLKDRVDDHIEHCTSCKKFKNEYLGTIELAKMLKPAPMTSDIQNRLRAALNEKLGLSLQMVAPD